jgi:hypothetical protein
MEPEFRQKAVSADQASKIGTPTLLHRRLMLEQVRKTESTQFQILI